MYFKVLVTCGWECTSKILQLSFVVTLSTENPYINSLVYPWGIVKYWFHCICTLCTELVSGKVLASNANWSASVSKCKLSDLFLMSITCWANCTLYGIILLYYPSKWKEEGKIIIQGSLFPSLDLNPVFLNVNIALLTSIMWEQTVLDLSKLCVCIHILSLA